LASNEKAGRPLWSLGFFIILSASSARAMNHNILHRTQLDAAGSRAAGLERLPLADGLFRTKAATATLESKDLEVPFGFDDLVGSFVAEVPAGGEAEMSVKVRLDDGWTDWFALGKLDAGGWTSPIEVPGAGSAAGAVDVDTLKLKKPATALRYRLKFKAGRKPVRLRSVAVAVSDAGSPAEPPAFSSGPWVRDLGLSPRSQGDAQEKYKHDICSPTSLAMVLEFWGRKLELEAVALAAQDRGSQLFGNWPANVAYAGSFGLEGRVARLESLADLEAEIAHGRPVVVSVTFSEGELPNAPIKKTRGHVMVVGGFTPEGDVIAYDPAGKGKEQVRRVYPRAAFHKVWRARKRGLAYLLGPAFPRTFTIGAPVADLWTKPVRRSGVKLDDEAHLSQILYGEIVTVLEAKGEWARVRAEEQESFLHSGDWQGYPGWMKTDALASAPPPRSGPIVRVRQALLQRGEDLLTLSVGTRLAFVSESGTSTVVRLLDGSLAEIPSASLYTAPSAPTAASRAEIIRTAELFLGTSYYWGGRSGVQADPKVGVDCSGLVSLAYRIHGRDVPRDSHEQKLHAKPTRSAELQAGDLIFLTDDETSDRITHVMIFTGGDGLIESRKSSGRVLRTTFLERFGQPLTAIESGSAVSDLSFSRPRRRRIFFGSYF
jgi:cell wall-associated NlpC family hydrolase